jgi:hypothetical protein
VTRRRAETGGGGGGAAAPSSPLLRPRLCGERESVAGERSAKAAAAGAATPQPCVGPPGSRQACGPPFISAICRRASES